MVTGVHSSEGMKTRSFHCQGTSVGGFVAFVRGQHRLRRHLLCIQRRAHPRLILLRGSGVGLQRRGGSLGWRVQSRSLLWLFDMRAVCTDKQRGTCELKRWKAKERREIGARRKKEKKKRKQSEERTRKKRKEDNEEGRRRFDVGHARVVDGNDALLLCARFTLLFFFVPLSFVSFFPYSLFSLCLYVSVPCVCCNMTIILGPDDQMKAPMFPLRFCSVRTHEPKSYVVCYFLPSTVGIPHQGQCHFSM